MAVLLDQFIETLSQSGLMAAGEVQTLLDGLRAHEKPETGEELAKLLVRRGKLTKFQAQCVYQGKTKGLVFDEYNVVHMRSPGKPYHPKGSGNGYVIRFGDKRVYVAGDTENIPEMAGLGKIDVAFLPMNLPYTVRARCARRRQARFVATRTRRGDRLCPQQRYSFCLHLRCRPTLIEQMTRPPRAQGVKYTSNRQSTVACGTDPGGTMHRPGATWSMQAGKRPTPPGIGRWRYSRLK